jgi:hypothetical protein
VEERDLSVEIYRFGKAAAHVDMRIGRRARL